MYPEGNEDEEAVSNFENMLDGLQLASAIVSGCDAFLTNDKQLLQEKEICCFTLGET